MTGKNRKNLSLLRRIARYYGVATSYKNYRKRFTSIAPDVLCETISAVSGERVDETMTKDDLTDRLDQVRLQAIDRVLPRTVVAWDGVIPPLWVWFKNAPKSITCRIEREEGGEVQEQAFTVGHVIQRYVASTPCVRVRMDWLDTVPFGYHILTVESDTGERGECFLISAPEKMKDVSRCWGGFAPAYALTSERNQNIGTYAELLDAARIIKRNGGAFFGTLPLLPVDYDGDSPETSPYSPLSRLFWNEIFLDVSEWDETADDGPLVDYPKTFEHKKRILRQAAKDHFDAHLEGGKDFKDYVDHNTHLRDYADFMARREKGQPYEEAVRYHLYVQYLCHVQLSKLKEAAEAGKAATLYLDYTVGVDPDGFDARRLSEFFIRGYQVGAPPDLLFIQGQTWGFEPLHPKMLEESRFQYFRDSLHHYFQYAKIIRLDHVMGLYRLYCVPNGKTAKHGSYIYYNLNAQLAVLCLEAWRHDAVVIGEDLGVVPDRIVEAMERHRISRMWIGQFCIRADLKKSFAKISAHMMAALNTHDMFPFAAYFQGHDIAEMKRMGFYTDQDVSRAAKEREKRIAGLKAAPSAYLAAIEGLARSKAQMAMINMEDTWDEINPQNIPGTREEYPNWRRKFAKTVEEWEDSPLFRQVVEILNRHRAGRA